MAKFALVQVRRCRKLPLVLVLVAICAVIELDQVQGVFAFRNMTAAALHGGMLELQRIRGLRMFFHPKRGRLESGNGVAGRTFAGVGALDELPVVLTLVATGALIECERLLEIAAGVALHATDGLMSAEQRVFGFGVVKVFADGLQGNTPPATCVVAGLTSLLAETSMVRISMTIVAFPERQADVARLVIRPRRVALLACHLRM